MAQQPDELSLELADVLNILDKTDDGMGWDRSRGRVGFSPGRQLLSSQEGSFGHRERRQCQHCSRESWQQSRVLLPPPNALQIQAALGQGRADAATSV